MPFLYSSDHAAAAASFGFVFIHPFEDGNGRIHRFLVHQQLAKSGFTPHQVLFPISAVMMRDRKRYDEVLESFSEPVSAYIDYHVQPDGSLVVNNQTAHLYKFWDATAFADLYECVAETIRIDLKEEIGFLKVFDAAIRATMDIVDMPDRRASLLIRLILQNNGRLSKTERASFAELTDDEISAIEVAVQSAQDVGTAQTDTCLNGLNATSSH